MNSALAALIGLALTIFLIVKKVSPFYSMVAGALAGGLLAGTGLVGTVNEMVSGVKDIVPAILRILAAGVLSGAMIVTGAADSISKGITDALGEKMVYLALALSAMILTAVGVFIDVAVITVAPIALSIGSDIKANPSKLLVAMIGGAKCGNIMSPNPNTIVSAENYGASLTSVMGAGALPAVIGLAVTVLILVPLVPGTKAQTASNRGAKEPSKDVPPFIASLAGPVSAILLMALRPLAGIVVDPLVALPLGGFVTLLATGRIRQCNEALSYGLGKMTGVAVLLVGTGTLAGIIKASSITEMLVDALSGSSSGTLLLAPLSGFLMAGATASTTAGATIASSSFASTVLAGGVSAVWAAAMTNASATIIDSLPFGSFFHATGGAVGISFKERMKIIPYEAATGLCLTICSIVCCLVFS